MILGGASLASAEDVWSDASNGIYFQCTPIDGNNVKIVKIIANQNNVTEITIPHTFEKNSTTYTITTIGNGGTLDFGYDNDVNTRKESITKLTVDEGIGTIASWCFNGWTRLTEVIMPSTLTEIGGQAFNNTDALTSITFNNKPATLGDKIFNDGTDAAMFNTGTTIYAPFTCMKDIRTAFSSYTGSPTYKLINIVFNETTNISDYTQDNIQAKNGTTFTVKRTLHAGHWNTLYLPFDMSWDDLQSNLGEGWKLYEFTGCNTSTDTMEFTQKTSGGADANVPYLLWVPAGYSKTQLDITGEPWVKIWGTPATVNPNEAGYKMIGTLAPATLAEGALFINGDKVYRSTGSSTIKAMSAYFEVPPMAGARSFTFSVDGQTTGIISIEKDGSFNVEETVYDLQGRKVTNPKHGLYIINGKKIMK